MIILTSLIYLVESIEKRFYQLYLYARESSQNIL